MTTLVALLVVIPAGLLSLALAAEAGRTFADFRLSALTLPAWFSAALGELPWFGPRLADRLVRALADPSALERWILANAGGWAAAVATAAGNVGRNALDAVLALFTLFFLYRDGPVLVPQIQRALHGLGGERFAVMFQPLGETIRAVMYGTLFTALSQGLLAMLGYWAAGLRAPVLLGALTLPPPPAWGGGGRGAGWWPALEVLSGAGQRRAPGPTGRGGGDRGPPRHACAAPLRLGSTWGRGVRCPRAGTGPDDPCRTRPSAGCAARARQSFT